VTSIALRTVLQSEDNPARVSVPNNPILNQQFYINNSFKQ